jgi:flagellin
MVVNHNMNAIIESRELRDNVKKMEKSSKKLSSGYKINGANDDAAGLKISETMRRQVKGLDKASRNSEDGISLLQTADAALQETQDLLDRMVELTTQAANDINTDADRDAIQGEIDQINQEIDRIAYTTNFNQQYMLAEGTPQAHPGYFMIQTGAEADQAVEIRFVNASKESLGVDKVDVSTYQSSTESIKMVQDAIEKAALWRDDFGAQQDQLERAARNSDHTSENTQGSESSMRDTDMNMEMVLHSTNRILVSASQSILAQYNDDAKAVIQLLK